MSEQGKSTPRPWREGEARVLRIGQIELADSTALKGALLEFPAGPPPLTYSVVWDQEPMRLVAVNSHDALKACAEALRGIGDDYMTSAQHHPGYVLIPAAKFEQLREALAALDAAETGGKNG